MGQSIPSHHQRDHDHHGRLVRRRPFRLQYLKHCHRRRPDPVLGHSPEGRLTISTCEKQATYFVQFEKNINFKIMKSNFSQIDLPELHGEVI